MPGPEHEQRGQYKLQAGYASQADTYADTVDQEELERRMMRFLMQECPQMLDEEPDSGLEEESSDIEMINWTGKPNQRAYVTARVRNIEKWMCMQAKVDPGNLTAQGVAISEDFQKRMNIGFSNLQNGKVGTAGTGLNMHRVGVSKTFDLRIQGIKRTFPVKAVVLRELMDKVNIGSGFLQQIEAATGLKPQLEFHHEGTTLKFG